jgi:hypothetical protein
MNARQRRKAKRSGNWVDRVKAKRSGNWVEWCDGKDYVIERNCQSCGWALSLCLCESRPVYRARLAALVGMGIGATLIWGLVATAIVMGHC